MNSQEMVQTQISGKIASLRMAYAAFVQNKHVADDESGLVDLDKGFDPTDYVRDLLLEAKTSANGAYTDMILVYGGPTVCLRSITATDQLMFLGTTASMRKPLMVEVNPGLHPEVLWAANIWLDPDIME